MNVSLALMMVCAMVEMCFSFLIFCHIIINCTVVCSPVVLHTGFKLVKTAERQTIIGHDQHKPFVSKDSL